MPLRLSPLGAVLVLLPLACTPLDGRPPRDASADAPASDAAPDVAADAGPVHDAPPCPRGATAAVDPRYALTLASDTPGAPTHNAIARAAAVDAKGAILVAGTCTHCAPSVTGATAAVWRAAPALVHDLSFGTMGVAVAPSARPIQQWNAVTTDAPGRIYLGGQVPPESIRAAVVARLLPDGSFDPEFGVGGQVRVERSQFAAAIVVALLHDDDGTVAVVIDQYPWQRWPSRAWALRLGDGGALDVTFGDRGVREIDDVHGCFDLARDGTDYVFACTSPADRPALRRLDAAGRVAAWASGAPAEAADAPARFAVRTLARDSLGRWVVAGPVTAAFNDAHSSVAAVRFLPDGSHDRAYGLGGTAVFLGPRQTFGYTFAPASRLGCEDRLLFGGDYTQLAVVGVLDARGRPLDALGDFGSLSLPLRGGTVAAAVEAIVPLPGSQDVVVVTSHTPVAVTLHRLNL